MLNKHYVDISNEVFDERKRQDAKWGEQNHCSISPDGTFVVDDEATAKFQCELAAKTGRLAWSDIACEELAETLHAGSDTDRRAELVQLAAVIFAWVECIDRNGRK